MKKTLLGLFAAATLAFALTSCGEKLLTEEQVQAEINAGFEAGRSAVESAAQQACDADFEARVNAEFERLKMAAGN